MMKEGTRINIILNNGWHYTGKILSQDEKELIILDIKNKKVHIKKDKIDILTEE